MKVLVFGTFDHLHPGHHFLLEKANERGDLHVVIARDQNVQHIKGFLPDHSEQERCNAVQEGFPDAHVILGNETDYLAPIRRIEPDLILLGYDQKLPPEIEEGDLGCTVERLEAFEPERYKSSFLRKE